MRRNRTANLRGQQDPPLMQPMAVTSPHGKCRVAENQSKQEGGIGDNFKLPR